MAEPSRALLLTIRVIDTFTDITGSMIRVAGRAAGGRPSPTRCSRATCSTRRPSGPSTSRTCCTARCSCSAPPTRCTRARISARISSGTASRRARRGLIDCISYVVFFFPSLTALGLISFHEAFYSFQINETSDQTPWRPILWPFKYIVPHRLPSPDDPGLLRVPEELLHGAHRHRARAQREGRGMTFGRVHRARDARWCCWVPSSSACRSPSRCCSWPSPSATSAWAQRSSTSPISRPSA